MPELPDRVADEGRSDEGLLGKSNLEIRAAFDGASGVAIENIDDNDGRDRRRTLPPAQGGRVVTAPNSYSIDRDSLNERLRTERDGDDGVKSGLKQVGAAGQVVPTPKPSPSRRLGEGVDDLLAGLSGRTTPESPPPPPAEPAPVVNGVPPASPGAAVASPVTVTRAGYRDENRKREADKTLDGQNGWLDSNSVDAPVEKAALVLPTFDATKTPAPTEEERGEMEVDGQRNERAKNDEVGDLEKDGDRGGRVARGPRGASGGEGDALAEGGRFATFMAGKDRQPAKPRLPLPPPPETRPEHFLPRMFYFENTYLGGNAAFTRRLLALNLAWPDAERPYADAAGPGQPFDAPDDAGLGLTAHLDRASFERPGRVFLQVGLQGSPRFGWRRPPLDLVLVVDAPVLQGAREAVEQLVAQAMKSLEATDRLAIVLSGEVPVIIQDLGAPRDLRILLARSLETLPAQAAPGDRAALGAAIRIAGARLREAAGDQARVPGAQEVLVLARGQDTDRVEPAALAAHEIGVTGVITSVLRLDSGTEALEFWDIAQAGQGNLRGLAYGAPAGPALVAEIADLSRVVARLIRVNVRLGPRVEAIRVLGSRMLDRVEVARVKAREEAVDKNLSKTLGVKADRGADDDGVQTVIPYFLGGDAHVMAIELWVDGPGPVADVSLKYKDMVALGNATARASVTLGSMPRSPSGAERMVRRNIDAFLAAERLAAAAGHLERGDSGAALEMLARAEGAGEFSGGQAVARRFGQILRAGGDTGAQSEALRLAAARTVGVFKGAVR